jgi:glycosyltransferase involved in cell wall biosynthesis
MVNRTGSNIKLSIALVTRNRSCSLARTLESLSKQSIQPYEVVISDDSDMQSMIDLNSELALKYGYTYITGPRKGLYGNRNFVAKQCSGTHIRTMDDDHEFPQNHLTNCIKAIEEERDTIWTIGEYYPSDKIRTLPAPIPGQLHPRGYSYAPKNLKKYYGISCGASIYPRCVVDRNILNVESYKFGILYLEYGARLYKNGYTIKPLSTTYIIHHYDQDNRSVTSEEVIESARIFSMLMFSFYHMHTFKNYFLTIGEIVRNLMLRRYPLKIIRQAYLQYKKESSTMNSDN